MLHHSQICRPAVWGLTWRFFYPPALLLCRGEFPLFPNRAALIICALNDLSWGSSSLYFLTQSQSTGTEDLVNTISHSKQPHMHKRRQTANVTGKIYIRNDGRKQRRVHRGVCLFDIPFVWPRLGTIAELSSCCFFISLPVFSVLLIHRQIFSFSFKQG